jgi:hypothetical protein
MPRTRGAVDKRPRKRHTVRRKGPGATPAIGAAEVGSNTGPSPEFLRTIEAELASTTEPQVQPAGHASTDSQSTCPPAPASPAADVPLTREAWEGVLRVPFRLAALMTQTPAVAQIGAVRCKDLARPSYVIFDHYARQYLGLDPDNELSLAWAATGLVLSDIAADCVIAIHQARAARALAEHPPQVAGGQVVEQRAA